MTPTRTIAGPAITALICLAIWEVGCRAFKVPDFVLPTPTRTIVALVSDWDVIWPNAFQTLSTTTMGFGGAIVFGFLLGVAVGSSPLLNSCFSPLLVAFNSVPKVAIVPVLVLWFGIGTTPAAITAFALSFFPITINVAAGISATEAELIDVLRSLGATRLDIIRKVGVPRSLPYLFASLKVAITLAFVGSVISETVASNIGIGYLMLSASAAFRIPLVFAALMMVAALGVTMYGLTALAERSLTGDGESGEARMTFGGGG
jgi:NitT/TauT family transport system permease protein